MLTRSRNWHRRGRAVDDRADQLGAQSLPDDRGLGEDAGGPQLGIDERGRRRQGRQIDLGRRTLRRQQLLGRREGGDVDARRRAEVRPVGRARAQLRRRADGLPARHSRRPRRQRLADRRPGQPAAPRPRRRARCAAAAAAGADCRASDLQVQPRRHAAAHARQGPAAISLARRPIRRRFINRTTSSPTTKGRSSSAEGHSSNATAHARISKFDRTGKFLKAWGAHGSAPGEFDQPHSLAWDSKGRLFVADRSNSRIQIFDQEGTLLDHGWEQYSRISGLWIDQNDMLYAADSESGSVAPARSAWMRGIRIGSIRDGKQSTIRYFIPDPAAKPPSTSAAEGVAVDQAGNIFGAEVGPRALKKYVKK